MTETFDKCDGYLDARTGTYEYRCRRYDAVIDIIEKETGLNPDLTIADLGAGWTEFGHRLTERGFRGRYIPYDGAIDGVDLEHNWTPPMGGVDWCVAIELLEHFDRPHLLVKKMRDVARQGVIITTPDSMNVDTLGMDDDHRVELRDGDLRHMGFTHVEKRILFPGSPWGKEGYSDTLVAWASK